MCRPRRSISFLAAAMTLVQVAGIAAVAAEPPRGAPIQQQHAAQDVQVELIADSGTLRVSDSLRVTLRITFPPTYRVQFPAMKAGAQSGTQVGSQAGKELPAKLGEFTLASVLDESPLASGTPESPRTTLTRRLTLEPFLPGSYTIPELSVTWRTLDGSAQGVIRTTPLSITVESLLPAASATPGQASENLDPGDIKPAMDVPAARSTGMLVIAVGTAITSALVFGVFMRRKAKDSDPLKDIEALLASWPHDGSDRPECSLMDALVRCGRGALADRLDPAAAACAGPELHRMLPKAEGDPTITGLISLIERLDEHRFSGYQPGPDDRRQYLADVLAAVRQLRTRARVVQGGAL
ncbi:MAG: hypothetical protein NTV94_14465 [Planctomycetota bacterium]|nr:hypothetical protein [Planctomycetota bacterium]